MHALAVSHRHVITAVAGRWQQWQGDGSSGRETVAVAGRRRQWQGDGDGGGTEWAVVVARRGWEDGVGGTSAWVGSKLGLRYVPWGGWDADGVGRIGKGRGRSEETLNV